MPSDCLNWNGSLRVLAMFLMLVIGACTPRTDPPPAKINLLPIAKTDPPPAKTDSANPSADPIVTVWQEAGAEIGWLRVETSGFLAFVPENEGKPGDLPAYRFLGWVEGRLAKMPAPAPAFALFLSQTAVTDAGLKELAGLKNLQALELYQTQVTDAGLK